VLYAGLYVELYAGLYAGCIGAHSGIPYELSCQLDKAGCTAPQIQAVPSCLTELVKPDVAGFPPQPPREQTLAFPYPSLLSLYLLPLGLKGRWLQQWSNSVVGDADASGQWGFGSWGWGLYLG